MRNEGKSEIQNHKSKIEITDRAGFEPATFALTERHSNQLSYLPLETIQHPNFKIGKGKRNEN
jgi:hypothetical protein